MSRLYLLHQARMRLVLNLITSIGIIIVLRLFYIQILNAEEYKENALDRISYLKTVEGDRGIIFDRNGIVVAENIVKITLWVNTLKDIDKVHIASYLNQKFDINEEFIMTLINSKKTGYLPLKKDIIIKDVNKFINEVNSIDGLNYDKSSKRFYPYGEVLAHLLGHTNYNGVGSSGIELQFDYYLKGSKKTERLYRSKANRLKNNDKVDFNSDLFGKDIYLSIDVKLQEILYEAIKKGKIKSSAQSANGIIVDVFSGDILAMSGYPSFDPNELNIKDIENIKNNTISQQYEPGSTLKVIPILEALSSDSVNKDSTINCEHGEYFLPSTRIKIHDHEPHGELSLTEILAYSSNIGIAKLASIVGSDKIYSSMKKFGLGSRTNVKLPGEEPGNLRSINDWSGISSAMVSMGQEISVTNLQLAMIYASIANNGFLLKPRIIKNINHENWHKENSANVIRRVMDKNQSENILMMLTEVVDKGTGNNASISGYKIAGKTGTAEKFINGSYSDKYFVSSFASIFPVDKPKYACIITVDSPKYHEHWGNITAAPIVRDIFRQMIVNDYITKNIETNESI